MSAADETLMAPHMVEAAVHPITHASPAGGAHAVAGLAAVAAEACAIGKDGAGATVNAAPPNTGSWDAHSPAAVVMQQQKRQ